MRPEFIRSEPPKYIKKLQSAAEYFTRRHESRGMRIPAFDLKAEMENHAPHIYYPTHLPVRNLAEYVEAQASEEVADRVYRITQAVRAIAREIPKTASYPGISAAFLTREQKIPLEIQMDFKQSREAVLQLDESHYHWDYRLNYMPKDKPWEMGQPGLVHLKSFRARLDEIVDQTEVVLLRRFDAPKNQRSFKR